MLFGLQILGEKATGTQFIFGWVASGSGFLHGEVILLFLRGIENFKFKINQIIVKNILYTTNSKVG
jgi:hypothetical protein